MLWWGMRFKSYVKENLRRSFGAWEKGESMRTLFFLLLAMVLAIFSATGAAALRIANQWESITGIGLGVAFIAQTLFITPYRMWSIEREKLEKFESEAKPKIRIGEPEVLTSPKGSNQPARRLFRIAIENLSTATIRNCRVREYDFVNLHGQHSGQQRHFRLAEESEIDHQVGAHTLQFDLKGKGDRQLIDIVSLDERSANANVGMQYANRPGSVPMDHIPRSLFPHDLTISVSADNFAEPIRRSFRIPIDNGFLRMIALPEVLSSL